MNSSSSIAQGWPQRKARLLDKDEVPASGAHLVTPWMGYAHHGIYVGDGKVVHYGALMYDIIRKPVEEVSLAAFAGGRAVFVIEHAESCLDAAEVVARARSRIGEKKYRLLTNNCEHFCEWALHGIARSFQAETSLAFPRLVGERLQTALLRCVQKVLKLRRPARVRIEK
ncbi:MAG TPA: lecithin retinol acyltransferase family protein [Steroidobacteraceae bacterium]|nr:lecithin retinol acyltransferase family protein [Steroidobacteraceae bacterium]